MFKLGTIASTTVMIIFKGVFYYNNNSIRFKIQIKINLDNKNKSYHLSDIDTLLTSRRIRHHPHDIELTHGNDDNVELTRVRGHTVGALHAQSLRLEAGEEQRLDEDNRAVVRVNRVVVRESQELVGDRTTVAVRAAQSVRHSARHLGVLHHVHDLMIVEAIDRINIVDKFNSYLKLGKKITQYLIN